MIFFLQYKQTFKEIVKIYGILGLWFIILRNNVCLDALQVVKLLKEKVPVWEPSFVLTVVSKLSPFSKLFNCDCWHAINYMKLEDYKHQSRSYSCLLHPVFEKIRFLLSKMIYTQTLFVWFFKVFFASQRFSIENLPQIIVNLSF